jgi:hypothetical protein
VTRESHHPQPYTRPAGGVAVSPYEWPALAAALALLALTFYATQLLADAWLRYRRDPDRAHRLFLSGRWWS